MIEAAPAQKKSEKPLRKKNALSSIFEFQKQEDNFRLLIEKLDEGVIDNTNSEPLLLGLDLGLDNSEISEAQYEALSADIRCAAFRSEKIRQVQAFAFTFQRIQQGAFGESQINEANVDEKFEDILRAENEIQTKGKKYRAKLKEAAIIYTLFPNETAQKVFDASMAADRDLINPEFVKDENKAYKKLQNQLDNASSVVAATKFLLGQNQSYSSQRIASDFAERKISDRDFAAINRFKKVLEVNPQFSRGYEGELLLKDFDSIRDGSSTTYLNRNFSLSDRNEIIQLKTAYKKASIIKKLEQNFRAGELKAFKTNYEEFESLRDIDDKISSIEFKRLYNALAKKNFMDQLSKTENDFKKVEELYKEIETTPKGTAGGNEFYKIYLDTIKEASYRKQIYQTFASYNLRQTNPTTAGFELELLADSRFADEHSKEFVASVITPLIEQKQLTTVFSRFGMDPGSVIPFIDTVENEEVKAQLKKDYLEYVTLRKNIRPVVYKTVCDTFGVEMRQAPFDVEYKGEEMGQNNEAFKFLSKKYRETLKPFIDSLKADPDLGEKMEEQSPQSIPYEKNKKRFLRQRVKELEQQRALTEIEKNYIRSVERLTLFNPDIIAALLTDFVSASAYLKNHFEELSRETKKEFTKDKYYPLIVIGAGPHGIISMGEIVRKDPELAKQTLIIDKGKEPGGPFAIPNGQAWDLNSANGNERKKLPREGMMLEDETVRGYGSPLRWYPGERLDTTTDTRGGSINKLVDWLPDPDQLSNRRYSTNEELQVVLSLHGALTLEKAAFETTVTKVVPAEDTLKGNKIVTIAYKEGDVTREVDIRTDNIIVATGLGEPYYGFDLDRTRAKRALRISKELGGYPKVTTTLEAFAALADRTRTESYENFGGTIAIYGIGNSTDTLVEYLGRLFATDVAEVKNVDKIYVISNNPATKRPRYAKNEDLRDRLNKKNLLSIIPSRVGDFAFDDDTSVPLAERKLVLFDENDKPILDSDKKAIKVDSVIAATGFRSQLDVIFEEYLILKKTMATGRKDVVLPANERVTVGQTFANDESILFVGTASDAKFEKDKLAQLPAEASTVLTAIGKEAVVAIGFRGPDTQAAVNIFVSKNEFDLESEEKENEVVDLSLLKAERKTRKTGKAAPTKMNVNEEVLLTNSPEIEVVQTDVFGPAEIALPTTNGKKRVLNGADLKRVLTSLLSYNFAKTTIIENGSRFDGELQCDLVLDKEKNTLRLANLGTYSETFGEKMKMVATSPAFQQYANTLLKKSRGLSPQLRLNIVVRNGRVDNKNTFVQ